MTGGDRDDLRRRAEDVIRRMGENDDLLEARDDWRDLWYSEDAEKWARGDDEDTPLWCVKDPDTGEVYDVNLTELWRASVATPTPEDRDAVLGDE